MYEILHDFLSFFNPKAFDRIDSIKVCGIIWNEINNYIEFMQQKYEHMKTDV